MLIRKVMIKCAGLFLLAIGLTANVHADNHESYKQTFLLETQAQVQDMRAELKNDGVFTQTFMALKANIDLLLDKPINVPVPADAGGGYTHEVHKKNYANMLSAGRIYLLSEEKKYADYVKSILLAYADMYPTLPLHPMQKEQSPGKLFWQSLNEAVWLVYTIQAYDATKDAFSEQEQQRIESDLFEPMVDYLSVQSPQTFDKIHNHGTWATAAVGMAGFVLEKPEWVEKSLFGLDKSGKGGFMRQLDELFSPQGYYNEGPYYQRYALMPFVLFAQAIDINQPERKIFEHRNSILIKAINTTIQLSYNGLFFGINDAIKDKGLDTIELVHGVAIAYSKTGEKGLLAIAQEQDQVLLVGYGLGVAQAIDNNEQQAYPFESTVFGDGLKGNEGALVVFRQNQTKAHQALVFKATSQGLGHGHFDKLHWMFYNQGAEIVYDYGAARFLNIEAKYGGHYLPENTSYAKQTIAHNTLVVDETSHFNGNTKQGNKYHPDVLFTEIDEELQVSSARMENAYKDVVFTRTQALINSQEGFVFMVDLLNVEAQESHQYDVPVHFMGQFIDTNVTLSANSNKQAMLGNKNGYQHLWLQAKGTPAETLAKVTWLKDNTFYTHTTVAQPNQELLMTRIGASDPNFNLIANQALITRVKNKDDHEFLSVFEVHGEYNGTLEYTRNSHSQLTSLENVSSAVDDANITLIKIEFSGGIAYLLALSKAATNENSSTTFFYDNKEYKVSGYAQLIRR